MLRVNELRSSTVEEPVNINPGHRGSDKSCPKTCDASVSLVIDKYISLGECEFLAERGSGKTVRS